MGCRYGEMPTWTVLAALPLHLALLLSVSLLDSFFFFFLLPTSFAPCGINNETIAPRLHCNSLKREILSVAPTERKDSNWLQFYSN